MKEKLIRCYERLQGLSITATKGNMETLLQCLYDLQDVVGEIERMERTETDGGDGGQEDHPGGRDNP